MLSYFIYMDKVGVDDEEVVEEEGALVLSAEDTQMVARWVLVGGKPDYPGGAQPHREARQEHQSGAERGEERFFFFKIYNLF